MISLLYLLISTSLFGPAPAAGQTVTVQEAVKRAMDSDRTLQALAARAEAARSLAAQAARGPNPEAELELENLGADGMALTITQPLELGGKKNARHAAAGRRTDRLELERERRSRTLHAATYRACIALAAAAEHLAILDTALGRADRMIILLEERTRAGAADPIDVTRARLDRSNISIARTAAARRTVVLGHELAALWNMPAVTDITVSGTLNRRPAPLDAAELEQLAADHPDVLLADAEHGIAGAERDLLQAEALPDLVLGAGYARNNETQENAFILSAGMELPFFNRNRDAITAAEHRMHAHERETDGIRRGYTARLHRLLAHISSIDSQLDLLEQDIAPGTAAVREQLAARYAQGAASMTDVLHARSAERDMHLRILDLVTERALLYADLLELTGHEPGIIE